MKDLHKEYGPEKTEIYFGKQSVGILKAHEDMMKLHYKALACHCECLGMNSENSWAVCANSTPPYGVENYNECMQKWGLINDKGEPII